MSALKHSKQRFICSVPRLLLLTAVLPLLIGCKETISPGEQQTVPKVTTAAVVQQETTDYDEYTGRTEASETVEIQARVFGYLKSIDSKTATMSKRARHSSRSSPTNTKPSTSNRCPRSLYGSPSWRWPRPNCARKATMAASRGAVSQEEYEEYVAAVREADANLIAAKADANRTAVDLKYTVVKAPISGRIDRRIRHQREHC